MKAEQAKDKCENRVDAELEKEINHIREIWQGYQNGSDEDSFPEYGLSFDYVPADTFEDQERDYFRYQLSWGGPSDEFRFYCDAGMRVHYIEYWFLDWFDGAGRSLKGDDYDLMEEIFEWFADVGVVESEYSKAMEE